MGNFDRGGNRGGGGGGGGFRGGNSGGRPSFNKKPWGGNDRGGDKRAEMHKATCSECGKMCEVPFRPSSDKPVFCNDCFSSKREGVDRKPRADFNDRAPRREFDRPAPRPDMVRVAPANDEVKNQLRDLNSKMDRLVTLMEKMTNSSAPKVAPMITKPAEVKKVVVASKPVAKVNPPAGGKKVVAKAPAKKLVAKKPVAKKKK